VQFVVVYTAPPLPASLSMNLQQKNSPNIDSEQNFRGAQTYVTCCCYVHRTATASLVVDEPAAADNRKPGSRQLL
jgi:hypothetical protein